MNSAIDASKTLQVEPKDHTLGRSKGGWDAKIYLLIDGEGTSMAVWVTPGQQHEATMTHKQSKAFTFPGINCALTALAGRG